MKSGDTIPELKVTPDAGLTQRYKDASGDPNPIHVDEFAKSVGLPGVILHGLYVLGWRGPIPRPWGATAQTQAPRGAVPRHGLPAAEITVSGTVKEEGDGNVVDTIAEQGDRSSATPRRSSSNRALDARCG